jgi:uncharacterized protein involved in copper resistance
MVSNSTNVNKTNNCLSPQIIEHPKKRYKNVAGLDLLMRSQVSPLENWISNSNTYTNNKKTAQICCHSQRPLTKTTHKDHSQRPLTKATHKDHSQRPHTKTTHKDHSQRPLTKTTHKDHSQRPHTKTTHKDHTQRPLTKATHKDHSQRPLTITQRMTT